MLDPMQLQRPLQIAFRRPDSLCIGIYTDRIKYLNTIRAEKAGITLEEYNTRDAASFPQKRYQTADEYARSVVFICSPANSAISGQVICVDGAMTTAY